MIGFIDEKKLHIKFRPGFLTVIWYFMILVWSIMVIHKVTTADDLSSVLWDGLIWLAIFFLGTIWLSVFEIHNLKRKLFETLEIDLNDL